MNFIIIVFVKSKRIYIGYVVRPRILIKLTACRKSFQLGQIPEVDYGFLNLKIDFVRQ